MPGNLKGAYLLAIGRCNGITGDDGLEGVGGGVEGVACVWEVWGKVDELGEAAVITEVFEVSSKVCSDWMEFCRCLSICEVINSNCKSSRNNGLGTRLDNSDSEKFMNREVSKCSSNGSSSRYINFTGQEFDLTRGWELPELSWLSCLLKILGIKFGFSNIGGGLGSGFDLV